jgi:hypothetical protein
VAVRAVEPQDPAGDRVAPPLEALVDAAATPRPRHTGWPPLTDAVLRVEY